MRRNLGTEVLIAIGAVSIIVCGLFFALLLSSTSDEPEATGVPANSVTTIVQSNTGDISTSVADGATVMVTDEPSETTTEEEATESPPKPTAVEEDTVEATATDTASDTPEPTETATNEPTETSEPTETATEEPTETATDEPTETATDEPTDTLEPTETATDEPTDTPEPTKTDIDEPTATIEPTDTPEPTETATDEPTETAIPTDTSTPTNTPIPTSTATATSSGYTGIIPTLPPSPTVAPLDDPTRTPASCELPRGWTTYTVQPGDTLFAISLATNSSVDELRFANCIDDIDNITAGEQVFVPVAPVRPVSTIVPSGIRQGLAVVGCTSPATQITSPIAAQRVSGSFTLYGTATRPDFQYYKIEVRPDFASIYNFYSDSQTQVVNGVLGQINANLFGPGLHWVRLSLVDIRGSIANDAICEIPMIFE